MSGLAGIDLGTTFTAAAVSRAGRREMVTLTAVAAAAPSVLYRLYAAAVGAGWSAGARGSVPWGAAAE